MRTARRGGSCEVWRATDPVLTRQVAVKLLHPGYARQPEALARFKAEALHAGALSHQSIARVPTTGTSRHAPYLVMELVDGPSLADVLAGGALDVGGPWTSSLRSRPACRPRTAPG